MRRATELAVLAVLALAGCTESPGIDISHVHGLAFDGEALFVATHHGLAKGEAGDDGSWTYVGDRYDYMGFTQDAEQPGVFYSSGHPDDPHSFGGVHLGLRRSTDGGHTWEQRSLKGEVDFHALTSIPGRAGWLAGSWQGAVKVSTDGGATWTDHPGPPAPVTALAGAQGALLAATTQGLYRADTDTFTWAHVAGLGFASSLAASRDGSTLYASTGNGQTGEALRSVDGGATWNEMVALRSPMPVLFAIDPTDPGHVFASTSAGRIHESRDGGATWATVR